MQRVKRETGMYTATEVATRRHVEAALKGGIDLLDRGPDGCKPFAMQEIADVLRGVDVPVLVKNPVSPDLELWIGAIERIHNAGIRRLGAIHRGFTSIDKSIYRNHPMGHSHRAAPTSRRRCRSSATRSHIGGKREPIALLSQQAMDIGFDGLIVEAHCSPDCAWSDKAQQVTPDALAYILRNLVIREQTITTESLNELRAQGSTNSTISCWRFWFAECGFRATSGSTRRSTTCRSSRHSVTRSLLAAACGIGRGAGHGPRIHAYGAAGHSTKSRSGSR